MKSQEVTRELFCCERQKYLWCWDTLEAKIYTWYSRFMIRSLALLMNCWLWLSPWNALSLISPLFSRRRQQHHNIEGLPVVAIVVSVTLISSAIIGVVIFVIYRKIALEAELNNSWWRVKWDDIRFAESHQSGSKKSTTSLGTSQGTLSTLGGGNTKISGATSVASSMNTTCNNISGVKVGLYKVCQSYCSLFSLQNFLIVFVILCQTLTRFSKRLF